MKILLDMNLSPRFCQVLHEYGWEAVHWSAVGDPKTPDVVIMEYARKNGYIVLTHDLDFSAMLAATQASAPSVIQVRMQDVLSDRYIGAVVKAVRQFEEMLSKGALVVIDGRASRARILPLT